MIAELLETQAPALPPASTQTLLELREKACAEAPKFKLQGQQRFLRRVLSPDSPVRNLLMVHGTGVGKTCTAIQVAEEQILRPEFRDHKVLVLANPAVQENFKREIFDVQRVRVQGDMLLSPQCTGRRQLDILQRIESEPRRWTEPDVRERLERMASRVIDEFYEFQGYIELAKKVQSATPEWIRENFNHRLVIVDEAHNLRARDENDNETETAKLVSAAMERLVKTAEGLVLVCLTATPMQDSQAEILFYFNLFLWNDRKMPANESLRLSDQFKDDLVKPEAEDIIRGWAQDQVSFVKGESPFTFPFRLPPPTRMLAPKDDRAKNPLGNAIPKSARRKQLDLVGTHVQGPQAARLQQAIEASVDNRLATIAVPPAPFKVDGKQQEQVGEKWLARSKLPAQAAKFVTVLDAINSKTSKGVCMVYSNFVEGGARLFAMALEEEGFRPLMGQPLLANPALESGVKPGSAGTYTLITQDMNDTDLRKTLTKLRQSDNREGAICRVIVTSPRVSEGVDFRFVRQVHILDPWFNMSRLEQVAGRGMRTCSHALLPPEEQNCTLYYHICRFDDDHEALDEFIYRTRVERKAEAIAHVRRILMESAMDCSLQLQVNALPEGWPEVKVPQVRSQDGAKLDLPLGAMMAPVFEDVAEPFLCKLKTKPKPDVPHVRPLSTQLDVRDEIIDELQKRFQTKPVWTGDEIRASMRPWQSDVVTFLLQDAVRSAVRFTDPQGRPAVLQSRGIFQALVPRSGTGQETLMQRLIDIQPTRKEPLPEPEVEAAPPPAPAPALPAVNIAGMAETQRWPADAATRFTAEVRENYIVDAVLTPEQRRTLLEGPPNRWNAPLEARIDTDRVLRIFGPRDMMLGTVRIDEPIGDVADAQERWLNERIERFAADIAVMSATYEVGGKGLKIWTFDVEEDGVKRKTKQKTVTPTAADSMNLGDLDALGKWLSPPGIPVALNKKHLKLPQLQLLIRAAGTDTMRWWTPEEWAVLGSESVRTRLRERIARK